MMKCNDVRGLVPRYLDNELAEDQAAPLRAHLIECLDCRAAVQNDKALEAWFVPAAPVAVPDGFAARVARRAQAGDPGLLVPVADSSDTPLAQERERVYSFLVSAVGVAALVLFSLAIALRRLDLPDQQGLKAESDSKVQSIEQLRQLNEQEEHDDQEAGR